MIKIQDHFIKFKMTMKYFLTLIIILITNLSFAQTTIPDFLLGTWKMENKETFEHWDKLNDDTLKGFSYKIKDGQMEITEYLDINKKNNKVIYKATVLNQNHGKGVDFKMTEKDRTVTFENFNHDFPKQIVYKQLSDTEIFVQVSDGKQHGFSYKMIKQKVSKTENDTITSNPNYDKALAEKLGGDDYGMKSYILVMLKTGTNKTTDTALINESFRGHLNNINKLVDQGKLIVAGPLGKNENNYRGIFILNNVKTFEEANELLKTDPAIINGLLDVELFNWYGSSALPEYLPISDKVWKLKP